MKLFSLALVSLPLSLSPWQPPHPPFLFFHCNASHTSPRQPRCTCCLETETEKGRSNEVRCEGLQRRKRRGFYERMSKVGTVPVGRRTHQRNRKGARGRGGLRVHPPIHPDVPCSSQHVSSGRRGRAFSGVERMR